MKKTIYWAVTAKCGHVGGLSKYIPITFYVIANSKKAASNYVITQPRVKHNSKSVILSVKNISLEEYVEGLLINENDPYLKCKNIQEQKLYFADLNDRILDEDDRWCLERNAKFGRGTQERSKRKKSNINFLRSAERMRQYCAEYGLSVA